MTTFLNSLRALARLNKEPGRKTNSPGALVNIFSFNGGLGLTGLATPSKKDVLHVVKAVSSM